MLFADVDVANSVQRFLNDVFAWLPELIGALLILAIGYFVAKLIGNLVGRALHRAGLDRTLHSGMGGDAIKKVTGSPSRLLGTVAFWAVWLAAISLAVSVLGINALTNFVAAIYDYLPNVIAAIAIFLVAGAVSAAAAAFAKRVLGDSPLSKIVGTAAPIIVMTVATFMILTQLQIAKEIVMITYAGLVGAIALATALAFGIGGREVASQMLQGAYEQGQENAAEMKRDLDGSVERAKTEVRAAQA